MYDLALRPADSPYVYMHKQYFANPHYFFFLFGLLSKHHGFIQGFSFDVIYD